MFTLVFCSKDCSEQWVDIRATPCQDGCYLRGTLLFYCSFPASIWFPGGGNLLLTYATCELRPLLSSCLFLTVLWAIYFAGPMPEVSMQERLLSKDRKN